MGGSTPAVVVMIGSPKVEGYARLGSRVVVTLASGTTTRGTLRRTLPGYEVFFQGDLRRNADRPKVSAGDRVSHSQRAGAMLTVLPKAISVSSANNGSLSTTCFPGGPFVVIVNDSEPAWFTTASSGNVEVSSLDALDGELTSGDRVHVGCENKKGGGQVRVAVVP